MPKYFTFEELWQSATADKLGIDNKPSAEIAFRLGFLAADLHAIREAWKSGIIVSSGYRCPELNEAVGGSETSVSTYRLPMVKLKSSKYLWWTILKTNHLISSCLSPQERSNGFIMENITAKDNSVSSVLILINEKNISHIAPFTHWVPNNSSTGAC